MAAADFDTMARALVTMGMTEATVDVAVSGAPGCLGHSQSIAVLHPAAKQIYMGAANNSSVVPCRISMTLMHGSSGALDHGL